VVEELDKVREELRNTTGQGERPTRAASRPTRCLETVSFASEQTLLLRGDAHEVGVNKKGHTCCRAHWRHGFIGHDLLAGMPKPDTALRMLADGRPGFGSPWTASA